jgi:hypothetical protein
MTGPVAISLQPASRHRLLPPGVMGVHVPALFQQAGISMEGPAGESRQSALLRLARPLLDPPEQFILAGGFLDKVRCVWKDGGNAKGVDDEVLSAAFEMPFLQGAGGMYAGEEGGLAMLEELECERGMVCDLGQTMFKVMWAGRRWAVARDLTVLPLYGGTGAHTIEEKGEQRRALRRFIAESLRTVLAEADAGEPEGVVFALPSAMDKWGQPAGSSYIGMSMDTQLVTDSLELAGLPDIPHWLLNDAELAATSAIFDERVIACGGKALVFTLGTAVGCALADPMAAALHFLEAGEGAG